LTIPHFKKIINRITEIDVLDKIEDIVISGLQIYAD